MMKSVIILLILLCASCYNGNAQIEKPINVKLNALNTDFDFSYVKSKKIKNIIKVGSGSGNLLIDGRKFKYSKNTLILIKKGIYKQITIKDIHGSNNGFVYVSNEGLVEIAGNFASFNIENVDNLIVSGSGDKKIINGIVIRDNNYRGITINDHIENLSLQSIEFFNIKDYSIYIDSKLKYDGSNESYLSNFSILHCNFINSGQVNLGGSIKNGIISGLIKNLEIAYDTLSNTSAGTLFQSLAVENYSIHNNFIHDVNQTNDNHNGIFVMVGNGSFYNNLIINFQGNSIRAWTLSFNKYPKDILIFNNFVFNSRKYSAFEVQSFSYFIINGLSTYGNTVIFHNTCGNLNLSNNWDANIVDIYNLFGGKIKLVNNLGYNFTPKPIENVFYTLYKPDLSKGNQYFKSEKDAGFSQANLKLLKSSPAYHAGIPDSLLTLDYNGINRNLYNPSVGAVEN